MMFYSMLQRNNKSNLYQIIQSIIPEINTSTSFAIEMIVSIFCRGYMNLGRPNPSEISRLLENLHSPKLSIDSDCVKTMHISEACLANISGFALGMMLFKVIFESV